jgi:hypothetical protein
MRRCGDCQLCCTVLPVKQIAKKANDRCRYAKFGKGCTLHSTPRMPMSCAGWSCAWLLEAPHLRRPDHGHYVVDMLPDFIVFGDAETGTKVPAIQVWCDPRHADAHEDHGLREYLLARARAEGVVTIVRYNERDAFVLVPPAFGNQEWERIDTNMRVKPHTQAEIAEVLGGVRAAATVGETAT